MQQADSGPVVLESTTAPPRTNKRARETGGGCAAPIGNPNDTADTASGSSNNNNNNDHHCKKAPSYGSQAYWEERYQAQFAAVHSCSDSSSSSSNSSQQRSGASGESKESTTLAYHSWYFTYDELRPLLLPLILGGREMARHVLQQQQQQQQQHEDEEDEGEEKDTTTSDPPESEPKTKINHKNLSDDKSSDGDGEEEEEEDDDYEDDDDDDGDDESGVPDREIGLAADGPVAILELGCGDVPLGASLALELHQLEQTITGTRADRIVSHILCTDSSPTVIAAMRQQYNNCSHHARPDQQNTRENEARTTRSTTTTGVSTPAVTIPSEQVVDIGNVPLEFATADARHLSYADQQFAMVLEKGTLDAVLSDTTHGSRDCISIVAEAARVLRVGGFLVLVSHLNAHTPNGLSWLEQVVFAGLQKRQQQQLQQNEQQITWEIEVHGHDEVTTQQEDEDDDSDDEDPEKDEDDGGTSSPPAASPFPSKSAGPAVYIIHKKSAIAHTSTTGKPTDRDPSTKTIPVKFFTY